MVPFGCGSHPPRVQLIDQTDFPSAAGAHKKMAVHDVNQLSENIHLCKVLVTVLINTLYTAKNCYS